jgi:hypothetical protein
MSVIPATPEEEIRKTVARGPSGKKEKTLSEK